MEDTPMTEPVKTSTVWHLLEAQWVDADPDCDVIAVTLQGNGSVYTVCCSGPKDMTSRDFISAMRIAVAGLIRAAGGDMSVVGCGTPDDAKFDTGNQRAN
jgi:hypothetical protein